MRFIANFCQHTSGLVESYREPTESEWAAHAARMAEQRRERREREDEYRWDDARDREPDGKDHREP